MHRIVQSCPPGDGDVLGVTSAAAEHLGHQALAPLGVKDEDVDDAGIAL